MEAFQSSVSVPLPADLPRLHGLHDLSILPHGLLASHHYLLVHPDLTAGNTRLYWSSYTQACRPLKA